MGTHISKVKSVSLDKWLPEMIKNMQVIGNANARLIYEGRLPDRYNRPRESDTYAVEQWIRDKYDRKKWYDPAAEARILAGDSSANPTNAASQSSQPSGEDEQRRARREERRRKREEEKKRSQAPAAATSGNLFDPFGSLSAAAPSATPVASAPAPSAAVDPNLMFSEFQSAGSSNTHFIEQNANASFFQQPGQAQVQPGQVQSFQTSAPAQPAVNSKDSIMSLFRAQPNAPATNGLGNFGGYNQMGYQPANGMGGMYMNQGVPQQQMQMGAIPNNMGMGAQGNYNAMYMNMNVNPSAVPVNNYGAPQNGLPANYGLNNQSGYQSPAANSYAYNHQSNRSAW